MDSTRQGKRGLIAFLVAAGFVFAQQAKPDLPALVKKTSPAVFLIVTYDAEGEALSTGTGFLISDDGLLATNYHVIHNASSAVAKAPNGGHFEIAGAVAVDKTADLAILKLKGKDLPSLELGDSRKLETGAPIFIVGSPLGLESTVTEGIVSAVRELETSERFIQISAAISEGSSGSPVMGYDGKVVGVATFLLKEGQSLNFAVPVEKVSELLSKKGKVQVLAAPGLEEVIEYLATAEGNRFWGEYLVGEESYEEAIPYLKKVIALKPNDADAYFYLGVTYHSLGRYAEAIEAYKQVIRLKPDLAEAHYNLGVAYADMGRYAEAVEAFKQAIRLKPDYADAHLNLGAAYDELGRYAQAVEAYKQAIRLKPDLADAHLNLGIAYGRLGRYVEALEAFKQAIRLKPDLAEAHYNLGVAYGELGRYAEAIEVYKQAIRLKPDYADAHYNLGNAYGKLGRYAPMTILLHIVQALFVLLTLGLMSGFIASKNVGVLLGAIAYGSAAIASFVLIAWWPLALGFVLAWILRFIGFDPGEE